MSGCDTIIDVRFSQGQRAMGDEPKAIAGERLERAGEGIKGSIAAGGLPRLLDVLREPGNEIEFQVTPVSRADTHAAVELHVSSDLKLTCQRCLGVLHWPLNASRQIVFAPTALLPDIEDEDELADFVPLDSRFVLRELIEDEILLSLPMVPAHADGGCTAELTEAADAKKALSPFAVLAKMSKQ